MGLEAYCGPATGWINPNRSDLGLCYQSLLFQVPPTVFILVGGVLRFIQLLSVPVYNDKPKSGGKLSKSSHVRPLAPRNHFLRMFSSTIIFAISAVFTVLVSTVRQGGSSDFPEGYPYAVVMIALDAVSWLAASIVLHHENARLVPSNFILRTFWGLSFISSTKFLHAGVIEALERADYVMLIWVSIKYTFHVVLLYYAVFGVRMGTLRGLAGAGSDMPSLFRKYSRVSHFKRDKPSKGSSFSSQLSDIYHSLYQGAPSSEKRLIRSQDISVSDYSALKQEENGTDDEASSSWEVIKPLNYLDDGGTLSVLLRDIDHVIKPRTPQVADEQRWKKFVNTLVPRGTPGSWRHTLGQRLEHHTTHMIIVVLIFLDLLVVIVESEVQLQIASLRQSVDAGNGGEMRLRSVELSERILHWTSVTILLTFCVEIFLSIVAFGSSFFTHYGHVLDFVVVPTSLALELTVTDVAGVLIVIRLWRFARVMHGIYESMKTQHNNEKDAIHRYVQQNLVEVKAYCNSIEDDNAELRRRIRHHRHRCPNRRGDHEADHVHAMDLESKESCSADVGNGLESTERRHIDRNGAEPYITDSVYTHYDKDPLANDRDEPTSNS